MPNTYITQAADYLKSEYGLEPEDVALRESLINTLPSESLVEFIDGIAAKYGLIRRKDMTVDKALRFMNRFCKNPNAAQ